MTPALCFLVAMGMCSPPFVFAVADGAFQTVQRWTDKAENIQIAAVKSKLGVDYDTLPREKILEILQAQDGQIEGLKASLERYKDKTNENDAVAQAARSRCAAESNRLSQMKPWSAKGRMGKCAGQVNTNTRSSSVMSAETKSFIHELTRKESLEEDLLKNGKYKRQGTRASYETTWIAGESLAIKATLTFLWSERDKTYGAWGLDKWKTPLYILEWWQDVGSHNVGGHNPKANTGYYLGNYKSTKAGGKFGPTMWKITFQNAGTLSDLPSPEKPVNLWRGRDTFKHLKSEDWDLQLKRPFTVDVKTPQIETNFLTSDPENYQGPVQRYKRKN